MNEHPRPANPLFGKQIILGVTGSIAAYKAADLASKLAQAGAAVTTVLTPAALQFLTPVTFQSVTGRDALSDGDLWGMRAHVLHVDLARKTDLFIIAPASANTIAKLANGLADNLLTISALAYEGGAGGKPFLLAPAMDGGMFTHPATQANLQTLTERGAVMVGPEIGHLASGLEGRGRMSEPSLIAGTARYLLSRGGPLKGRRIVVTAGGTREALDPVRIITNLSSGKQGYALAQACLDAGAAVTLVSAPCNLASPVGADFVSVQSAAQMADAVLGACRDADALLMAAAVADFRPANPAEQKIKKAAGLPALEMIETTDILKAVAAGRAGFERLRVVVGFAAETRDLLQNAQKKLEAKNLDIIAANDVSAADAGFSVDTNRVVLLFRDGTKKELPLMRKEEVAAVLVSEVQARLG